MAITARRYFAEVLDDQYAVIKGAEAGHLTRVMRVNKGEEITFFDGAGMDYTGCILEQRDGEILLDITGKWPSDTEADLYVHLYLGMTKGGRLEWAMQKCVELGCASITPFYSEFSVVKPKRDEEKTERYNRIAHEAAKQCGRGVIPKVFPPLEYGQMLGLAAEQDIGLFCYERGGVGLGALAGKLALQGKSIAVITGPEGGFSPQEYHAAREKGLHVVSLGARILRSETAPVAVLSALMALSGNM